MKPTQEQVDRLHAISNPMFGLGTFDREAIQAVLAYAGLTPTPVDFSGLPEVTAVRIA